jgi:hypothetical protein
MAPRSPSPTTLNSVQVTDLTSPTAGGGEWSGNYPGTRGDDSIPANAAVLVRYPLQLRYQGGHPRTYLLAGGNADMAGATEWSTGLVGEIQTHWPSMLNQILSYAVGGTTLQSVVMVSYVDKEENPTPPYRRATPLVVPLPINLIQVEASMASQRRRIGRGAGSNDATVRRMAAVRRSAEAALL